MRNQKGITLIALVITIIVLLILAGVSIAMLTGDNGILTQSNKATVTTIEANVKESVRLALQAMRLEIANEAATDHSYDAREHTKTLTDAVLADLQKTSGEKNGWTVTATPATDTKDNTSASFKIKYNGTDYTNARNLTTAYIEYAVKIDQQAISVSEQSIDTAAAVPTN